MTPILKSYRPYFVILAVFVVMLMLIDHRGEFPLIDDWAYAHGVSDFLFDGVLKISDWVAMTQVAHLFAGVGWSMIFGFSLENLREFTLLMSLIGAFLMYYGTGFFTRSLPLRLIGTLILIANPLWIYLSHTFMTDIPFTVLFLGLVVGILKWKREGEWERRREGETKRRREGEWEEKHKHREMRGLLTDIVKAEPSAKERRREGENERKREGGAERRSVSEFVLFGLILVMGVLIVLVRQTGLGIGLSFLLWVMLMDPPNRRRLLVPALILAGVQILTLVGYEWVMSDVGALSTRYHGASSLSWILSRDWWVVRAMYYGLIQFQHLGMFLLPLLPFVIMAVWKRRFPVGAWLVAGVLVLGTGVAVGGDILMNPRYTHLMQYDTVGHVMTIDFTYDLLNFSRELYPIWMIIHILGLINLGGWVLLGWNSALKNIRKFPKSRLGNHPVYWMILILLGYTLFISIGQFVFDRYLLLHIPLLIWIILTIVDRKLSIDSGTKNQNNSVLDNVPSESIKGNSLKSSPFSNNYLFQSKVSNKCIWIAGILIIASFLFGVTGTRDSFEWNRVSFSAIDELVDSGISPNQIDGGAEYNSWMNTAPLQPLRMHEKSWWYVDGDEYAIAFHEIPGYERLRSYEFSMYYGLKKDTIWVIRRTE